MLCKLKHGVVQSETAAHVCKNNVNEHFREALLRLVAEIVLPPVLGFGKLLAHVHTEAYSISCCSAAPARFRQLHWDNGSSSQQQYCGTTSSASRSGHVIGDFTHVAFGHGCFRAVKPDWCSCLQNQDYDTFSGGSPLQYKPAFPSLGGLHSGQVLWSIACVGQACRVHRVELEVISQTVL